MTTIAQHVMPRPKDDQFVARAPAWFADGTGGVNERGRDGLPTSADYLAHERSVTAGPWAMAGITGALSALVGVAAAGALARTARAAVAGAVEGVVIGGGVGYALGHASSSHVPERARAGFERDFPRSMFDYVPIDAGPVKQRSGT